MEPLTGSLTTGSTTLRPMTDSEKMALSVLLLPILANEADKQAVSI